MGKVINNIKDYFISNKNKLSGDVKFVEASKSPRTLERNLIRQINAGKFNSNKMLNVHTNTLSLVLSKLGVKSGVNFDYFKPKDTEGFDILFGNYSEKLNKLSFNEKFSSAKNLAIGLATLAHEVMHKSQYQKDVDAKYFTKNMHDRFVGDEPIYSRLSGFSGGSRAFYEVNKVESEALKYGFSFAERLLKKVHSSQRFSFFNRDKHYLNEQREYISLMKDSRLKNNDLRENIFINAMPSIYERSMKTFDSCLSLANNLLRDKPLSKEQVEFASLLDKTYEDSERPLDIKAIGSMAVILSRCPIRENVEKYIDFSLSHQLPNLATNNLWFLIEQAVPLTKGDITRFVICGNSGKQLTLGPRNDEIKDVSPTWLNPNIVQRIDENEIVKSYLVSFGKESTLRYFNDLQKQISQDNINANIDFSRIYSVVESYSESSLVVNGKSFNGCSSLLNASIDKLLCEGKIQPNQVNEIRADISKNLVNIVSHFGFPQPDDKSYLKSLEKFYDNPFQQQFANSEKVSEFSHVHIPELSEKLAEFISAVREQGTQENPQATVYSHTNIHGQEVTDELLLAKTKETEQAQKELNYFVQKHNLEEAPKEVKQEEEQKDVASKVLSYYRQMVKLDSKNVEASLKEAKLENISQGSSEEQGQNQGVETTENVQNGVGNSNAQNDGRVLEVKISQVQDSLASALRGGRESMSNATGALLEGLSNESGVSLGSEINLDGGAESAGMEGAGADVGMEQ